MKKLRYFQTAFARLQLISASVILSTAPQWHWMQCQGLMYDVPIWAMTAFVSWHVYRSISFVPISHQERQRPLLAYVSARRVYV